MKIRVIANIYIKFILSFETYVLYVRNKTIIIKTIDNILSIKLLLSR